ncbi:MAG: hypothetical protein JNK05_36580 [Myxococcales bacterium]|nr:hypothetical protein [Myxococcales bacterium]
MTHRTHSWITLAATLAAVSVAACRKDPPRAQEQAVAPAPDGVARWRLDAPGERLREGAILVDPPSAANGLVPAVPTALRRIVEECRDSAPAHGEERVEVRFDISREGRVQNSNGTIGGPFASCIATHLTASTPEIGARAEVVHVVARLIVRAPIAQAPAANAAR